MVTRSSPRQPKWAREGFKTEYAYRNAKQREATGETYWQRRVREGIERGQTPEQAQGRSRQSLIRDISHPQAVVAYIIDYQRDPISGRITQATIQIDYSGGLPSKVHQLGAASLTRRRRQEVIDAAGANGVPMSWGYAIEGTTPTMFQGGQQTDTVVWTELVVKGAPKIEGAIIE